MGLAAGAGVVAEIELAPRIAIEDGAGDTCTDVTELPTDLRHPEGVPASVLKARGSEKLLMTLRAGMMLEGMDLWHGAGAVLSIAHTDEDIVRTIEAFDRVLARMKAEGLFDEA